MYEAIVLIPILDITLRTPLPKDLIKLRTAFSGVIPVITPCRTKSSAVSIAKYGLTAAAPYPIKRATWCTSLTSPASITSPTLVRVFSRIKWWCTAEVNKRDGMGASSASASRSDRTMMWAPSLMACETSVLISSRRSRRESPPSATKNKPRITCALKPGYSPSALT